jgi:hypothetical protein
MLKILGKKYALKLKKNSFPPSKNQRASRSRGIKN